MAFGALSSGISALRSFSKGMEVIGNNIANVNTVSFKGSRIKYSETFNQVLRQSAPTPSDGKGSNVQASQVGLGVQVEGISGQFHQGGLSATSQPTDLAVSGEGFFLVKDEGTGKSFATRGGDFRIDDNGFLVTSEGYKVQGMTGGSIGFEVDVGTDGEWSFVPNQNSISGTVTPDEVGDIRLDYNKGEANVVDGADAQRNSVDYTNNLIAREADGETGRLSTFGTAVTAANNGALTTAEKSNAIADAYGHRIGGVVFDDSEAPTTVTGVSGWHAFAEQAVSDLKALRNRSTLGATGGVVTDSQIEEAVSSDFFFNMFSSEAVGGVLPDSTIDGNAVEKLFLGAANATDTTAASLTWDSTIDPVAEVAAAFDLLPEDFKTADAVVKSVRAEQTPDLARFSVDGEGTVRYFLDNGDSFIRGQVGLMDFNDKTALIREGRNLYSGFDAAGVKEKTADNPTGLQIAGRGGLGSIQQGALELSNVDLTNEFANMITTQRGFQAGSRIITVADDILQEVVNLKR